MFQHAKPAASWPSWLGNNPQKRGANHLSKGMGLHPFDIRRMGICRLPAALSRKARRTGIAGAVDALWRGARTRIIVRHDVVLSLQGSPPRIACAMRARSGTASHCRKAGIPWLGGIPEAARPGRSRDGGQGAFPLKRALSWADRKGLA